MEIRGKTISYASYKKKKDNKTEQELNEIIIEKEKNSNLSEDELAELETTKAQLEQLRRKRTEGMIVRSRVKWITDGDKPTRYFCSLEKRNFTNRSVSFLETTNGDIVDEQTSILREVENFYETLYKAKNVREINLAETIKMSPKLENKDHDYLEGKITYEEAATILRRMENNKSPGPDGFTTEFF